MKDGPHLEQQFLLLEVAASNNASDDFAMLLEVCGLPLSQKHVLTAVLNGGRWRESENPDETIILEVLAAAPSHAVARALMQRDQQGRNRREVTKGYSADKLGWFHEIAETSELITVADKPGVRRRGGSREEEREQAIYGNAPESMKFVPAELRTTRAARVLPDWTRIAERAGLDRWETKALECMAQGFSRYASMKVLENPVDKRALEAAWRRLVRSNFEKVRSILVDP